MLFRSPECAQMKWRLSDGNSETVKILSEKFPEKDSFVYSVHQSLEKKVENKLDEIGRASCRERV